MAGAADGLKNRWGRGMNAVGFDPLCSRIEVLPVGLEPTLSLDYGGTTILPR